MSAPLYEAYFDGLCEPRNPGGVAAYGFVVYKDGEVIHEGKGVAGRGAGATNNLAEYSACGAALKWLLENVPDARGESLVIRGDSQLVVKQMTGVWGVQAYQIRSLWQRACALREALKNPRMEWVPREENEAADALSVLAYVKCQEDVFRRKAPSVSLVLQKPAESSPSGQSEYLADRRHRVLASKGEINGSCSCRDFREFNRGRIHVRCGHVLAADEAEMTAMTARGD